MTSGLSRCCSGAGSGGFSALGSEFLAADLAGVAHDITLNGVLSGPGNLLKAGFGRLTLDGAHTLNGNIVVQSGTLALGAMGGIANVPRVIVGSAATLDITAATSFVHGTTRTIGGFGLVTGHMTASGGAIINPGSNDVPGMLTFNSNMTQQGGDRGWGPARRRHV